MKSPTFYPRRLGVLLILVNLYDQFSIVDPKNVFRLTMLHTTNIFGRYEQTNEYGGPCIDELAKSDMCFGGYARRVTKIKEIRDADENVLLLEAGNRFLGIPAWFDTYNGLATAHFMNLIGYDAMSFGYYDFIKGIPGVLPFLNNITFPVVMSNVDSSKEPRMKDLYVTDHVIKFTNGERVGIVGYMWEFEAKYTDVGELVIYPVVESLQSAVDSLRSRGIDKIIALGYSSDIDDAVLVARKVRGIDVVVTSTKPAYLYPADEPFIENSNPPYPIVINPDNDPSATVLVVTTSKFGKHLGYLTVKFNNKGAVMKYDGKPILLDHSIPQDPAALAEVQKLKSAVEEVEDEVVGESLVRLYGLDRCGLGECNMGNFVADAVVWDWTRNAPHDGGWTGVTMAMILDDTAYAEQEPGPVTYGDIKNWFVWADTFDLIHLQGKHIIAALEHAAAPYGNEEGYNLAFFQVSGMKIVFDMTKPAGSRVVSVLVKCRVCDIPEFVPLEDDKDYRVVVNSYIAGGGAGYDIVSENLKDQVKGRIDADIVRDYIKFTTPVAPGLEGRIVVYNSQNPSPISCNPEQQ